MAKTIQQVDKLRYDLIGGDRYQYSLQVASVATYAIAYMKGRDECDSPVQVNVAIKIAMNEMGIPDNEDSDCSNFFDSVRRKISLAKSFNPRGK